MTHKQLVAALEALRPGAQWVLSGDDFSTLQWLDETQRAPSLDDVTAWVNANPNGVPTFLARDLLARFTIADYAAIKQAIVSDDALGLLWASLQAQGEAPISAASDRFRQGWTGLAQALGATRAAEIAAALGISVA